MVKVLVTGDITVDWNLFRSRRSQHTGSLWEPDFRTKSWPTRGGAALLAEMIDGVKGEKATVLKPELTNADLAPGRAPFWHSYSSCERFLKESKDAGKNAPTVWRIKEFLGLEQTPYDENHPPRNLFQKGDRGDANLIVVDNANQGFSQKRDIWPESLKSEKPKGDAWLLLKWSRPDFDQPDQIWGKVVEHFKNRLIVVVTVNDLRLREMKISRALSWERTALDLVREIIAKVPDIESCAHFVVSIYTEGALVISRNGGSPQATLYYDPKFIEGTWAPRYPGVMAGYTQCLVAGIAGQMMQFDEKKDIGRGILAGISAARWLHENGFEDNNGKKADDEKMPSDKKNGPSIEPELASLDFPTSGLVEKINEGLTKPSGEFRKLDLDGSMARDLKKANAWTILKKTYPDDNPERSLEVASEIIKRGPERAWDVPVGKFGKLLAINRAEIESLRCVRSLIEEYAKSPVQKAPLSIAVFGPPGTGKSFTIREVAASFESDGNISDKELIFNLSQFTAPESIYECLHQVRDVALSEKIPLVFWDEFDTRLGETELGWLRYFLAPMQDGQFQHGALTHNVGRAIFVFAGGTRTTMEQFEKDAHQLGSKIKGTDFLSRLKGYVDILGLDHPENALDSSTILRRALLLRSILLRSAPWLVQRIGKDDLLNVDSGVLKAFLYVPKYNYGARSMEAIARMSRLSGKLIFERSSLPLEAQLNLHVKAEAFMALVGGTSST